MLNIVFKKILYIYNITILKCWYRWWLCRVFSRLCLNCNSRRIPQYKNPGWYVRSHSLNCLQDCAYVNGCRCFATLGLKAIDLHALFTAETGGPIGFPDWLYSVLHISHPLTSVRGVDERADRTTSHDRVLPPFVRFLLLTHMPLLLRRRDPAWTAGMTFPPDSVY